AGVHGEYDQPDVGARFAQRLCEIQATAVRQADVDDGDHRLGCLGQAMRLRDGGSLSDDVEVDVALECTTQALADELVVVHEHDRHGHVLPLSIMGAEGNVDDGSALGSVFDDECCTNSPGSLGHDLKTVTSARLFVHADAVVHDADLGGRRADGNGDPQVSRLRVLADVGDGLLADPQ